ncbi:hypothetical protein AB447_207830 [Bacillus glycinifermentans]|uniref:Uncharacterized protein n=1 Tax=Bacillus glycinifermentans TaxID=1664069 RepID=A0A0T6BIK5_9BACI|nr:hypothetical protein AB447_207830 [Bacillus glycinifermentans]
MVYKKPVRISKKQVQLCYLLDELYDQVNVVIHDAVLSRASNRLSVIEDAAKEVERISKEMQQHVDSMRRKRTE